MEYTLMSGAGNLFVMLDGFQTRLPEDPAALARSLCGPRAQGGLEPRPDGLLLVRRPRADGACVMELYNADGSRPETCGNGLRCVAKLVHDRGHVQETRFVIETDAGPRPTEVFVDDSGVARARVHMGAPKVLGVRAELVVGDAQHVATLVDVGNPHCVLFVADERTAPVGTLGPALERHPRFPRGTNVEFLAARNAGFFLRVWERGVGETQACGSGACAAAVAAHTAGIARWPIRLQLPGGVLEVDSDGRDGVHLTGPVNEIAHGEWSGVERGMQAGSAQVSAPRARG